MRSDYLLGMWNSTRWLPETRLRMGGAVPEGKIPELVYTLRSYQTLFHRVVLKLIGFQGQYIDYSSLDFPDRPLLEPLGGPQGDGKPVPF